MSSDVFSDNDRAFFLFLKHSSPDAVFSALQEWCLTPRVITGDIEQMLLERNMPLIDLALAMFSENEDVLRELYEKADADLKTVILNNSSCWHVGEFALGGKEGFFELIVNGDYNTRKYLLSNGGIPYDTLTMILNREGSLQDIDDTDWWDLISYASVNPRIKNVDWHYEIDGFSNYLINQMVDAILSLAEQGPYKGKGSAALPRLIHALPDAYLNDTERLIRILNVWETAPEEIDIYAMGVSITKHISPFSPQFQALKNSPREEYRCCYYDSFSPSDPVEIVNCFKQDYKKFDFHAVRNTNLYRKEWMRRALHNIVWKPHNNDLLFTKIFDDSVKKYEESHPDWFKDKDVSDEEAHRNLPKALELIENIAAELKSK
jgi:hypothetical protein